MEAEWQPTTLGDLIDVKHGFAFSGEFICDEPTKDILLTPGNFAIGGGFKGDKFKYYNGPIPADFVLRSDDLLITMTDLSKQADTLGYPAFVPSGSNGCRYLHNQRLGKVQIREPDQLNARYLYYRLCSRDYRQEVLASATGTTVKHTSPERIKRFRFLVPPIEEQRAIARILGALDDKIELNRRMSETLEAMARALFKSWFVDFDPVRAKAEGRDPGLPKEVADLFPDRFVESELGEIPEGWKTGTFGELAELLRDQINPLAAPDDIFQHFSIPAFDDGQCPKTEQGAEIRSLKFRVPSGVVLLSKLNPDIERAWLVDVRADDLAVSSTEFLVLKPRLPYGRSFLYSAVRSRAFRTGLQALVTGTSKSHQRAQADSVLALPSLLPPADLVEAFERCVEPILSRVLTTRRESATLAALRDTLLPKLISGELRVKEATEQISEATAVEPV